MPRGATALTLTRQATIIHAMWGLSGQLIHIAAAIGILAGLVLKREIIRRSLRRELMQESVIYQELREEERQEAREEIRRELRSFLYEELLAEAKEEVRRELQAKIRQELQAEIRTELTEETKQSEVNLVLRMLVRRLQKTVPPAIEAQVRSLSFTQLEALGEALLDFTTLVDVEAWLAMNSITGLRVV